MGHKPAMRRFLIAPALALVLTACENQAPVASAPPPAAPVAKVLKRVAERVERCNHTRASAGYRVHVGPLSDDAEGMRASFDDIAALKSRPFNIVVSVEKFLLASRLNLETDGIERSHCLLPTCRCDANARR